MVTNPSKNHALGCLLGAACGDAFGTTLEFKDLGVKAWVPLLEGPHTQILGKGPFDLIPGQVTDDTQMACCLANSLVANGGKFDVLDVASRYLEWKRHAFDIGTKTSGTLSRFAASGDPLACGIEYWREIIHNSVRTPNANAQAKRLGGALLGRNSLSAEETSSE